MIRGIVDRRLLALEKAQGKGKKIVVGTQDYWFRCVPTCPPSTVITIRAGVVYPNPDHWFWLACQCQVPETRIDFSDPQAPTGASGEMMDKTWTFSNPYWYRTGVLAYNYEYIEARAPRGTNNWPYAIEVKGYSGEYETATEAEARIDGVVLNGGVMTLEYSTIPLWAVVIRNNGALNEAGAVMEIDPINRGRSYIYRDCRVRNNIW